MKTNRILSKPFRAGLAGLLAAVFFFSCNETPSQKEKDSPALAPAFVSHPLPQQSLIYMKKYFSYAYLNGVNPSIDTNPIFINPVGFLDYFGSEFLAAENHGLGIQYVLLQNESNQFYFSYAVSKAQYDGSNWIAAGLSGAGNETKYLLLLEGGNAVTIEADSLMNLQEIYKQNTKNKSFSCVDSALSIDSLDKHPLRSFHDGRSFLAFYHQNIDSAGNPNAWKLCFDHGAIHIDIFENEHYWVQTPVLYFKDENGIARVFERMNPINVYQDMMLDLGHLCPPNCND